MLNLNAEICIQKPKLAFQNKYLTNFFFISIFSTYEDINNNFNMHNVLMVEKIDYTLCIKKTKLSNLRIIKEKSAYFTAQKKF